MSNAELREKLMAVQRRLGHDDEELEQIIADLAEKPKVELEKPKR